ncbi:FtsX-like permease family protein [Propioniciclava soli]|uniref:FtsX-like permease family protein n=1 Tax=Propioniciclava soli TaxID=2775081 RepID=UPI001E3365C0|nr:FtsX-like permease family protein [Propioniciclava soli]
MHRVHLGELRNSWSAWAGVSVTFVTVNAALALIVLMASTGFVSGDAGVAIYAGTQLVTTGFLILLVSLPVLASATSLVVNARRGALARLALVGATPSQVRSTLVSQLVAVSLASALVGDLLAFALARPWMALDAWAARNEGLALPTEPGPHWGPVLAVNVLCAGVAVLAGARQASCASSIPPIEALRQAMAPMRDARLTAGGWVALVVIGLGVTGAIGAVVVISAQGSVSVVGHLIMAATTLVFVLTAGLAVAAPVVVAPLTRAWTALVPSRAPARVLARSTVSARADRLYKSVIPVMFALAIGIGVTAVLDSSLASMVASGGGFAELSTPAIADLAALFGLPLAIAFSSGIGSLVMMGRQRDAELALLGIVGGTPAQRSWIPVWEAVIITVNAALLSLIVTVPSLIYTWFAITAAGATFVLVVQPWLVALLVGGGIVGTALTTVLPTLPAQRLPEPRVVARLVGE